MGRKRRGGPGEALDKAVGRVGEAAGRAAGDESLETQGRALRRKGELKTYAVLSHANGGWKVQAEGADRASSVHRTRPRQLRPGRSWPGGRRRANSWSTRRTG